MKSAVVTGASSGIGKEIAKELSRGGFRVALIARRKELLDKLCGELGDGCLAVACDLADPEQIKQAGEKILDWSSSIDALVNNAGIYRPASLAQDNDEVWQQHFTVNLMSAVRMTRFFWPTFTQQKSSSIVNITSTLAIKPIANTSAYSALKAAMNNWTQSLAIEGAPFGIRANAVCPGLVDTPIHGFHSSQKPEDIEMKAQSQKIQPLGRIGTPSDIAPLVRHLASEQSSWTTGTMINVDGGILLNS